MVFNDQPFYNEPGFELRSNPAQSERYNRNVEYMTVKYAMLPWLTDGLIGPEEPEPMAASPIPIPKPKGHGTNTSAFAPGKPTTVVTHLSKALIDQPGGLTHPASGKSGHAKTVNWEGVGTHPANTMMAQVHQESLMPFYPQAYSYHANPASSHAQSSTMAPHSWYSFSSGTGGGNPIPPPTPADLTLLAQTNVAEGGFFSQSIAASMAPAVSHPAPTPAPATAAPPAPTPVAAVVALPRRNRSPSGPGGDPIWSEVIGNHFGLKAPLVLATVRRWELLGCRGDTETDLAIAANKLELQLKRHGFNN